MSQQNVQKNLFIKNGSKMLIFALFIVGSMTLSSEKTSAFVSDISRANIISLTNIERTGAGLPRLVENETLNRAAQLKLDHMIKNDYFAHNAPDGTTPWQWFEAAGYDYQHAGENLAMDFDYTANQHKAWMNSTTHRQNIMSSKYTEIGVATGAGRINGDMTTVTVQVFGTPINIIPVKGVSTENQKLNERSVLAPVPTTVQETLTIPTSIVQPSTVFLSNNVEKTYPLNAKQVGYIAWTVIIVTATFALIFDSILLYRIHMKQHAEEGNLDAPPTQI